ncbi:hypothetical protein C1E47_19710 [Vibrio cholerae]|nr:hypothetical protein [Vibrio cholerae]EGR5064194.1 hypothetical protein [Vibrio cholerae]
MQLLCLSLVVMRCQPLRRALVSTFNRSISVKKIIMFSLFFISGCMTIATYDMNNGYSTRLVGTDFLEIDFSANVNEVILRYADYYTDSLDKYHVKEGFSLVPSTSGYSTINITAGVYDSYGVLKIKGKTYQAVSVRTNGHALLLPIKDDGKPFNQLFNRYDSTKYVAVLGEWTTLPEQAKFEFGDGQNLPAIHKAIVYKGLDGAYAVFEMQNISTGMDEMYRVPKNNAEFVLDGIRIKVDRYTAESINLVDISRN